MLTKTYFYLSIIIDQFTSQLVSKKKKKIRQIVQSPFHSQIKSTWPSTIEGPSSLFKKDCFNFIVYRTFVYFPDLPSVFWLTLIFTAIFKKNQCLQPFFYYPFIASIVASDWMEFWISFHVAVSFDDDVHCVIVKRIFKEEGANLFIVLSCGVDMFVTAVSNAS